MIGENKTLHFGLPGEIEDKGRSQGIPLIWPAYHLDPYLITSGVEHHCCVYLASAEGHFFFPCVCVCVCECECLCV